ncbi:MAG: hypothetical protein ORN83_02385, partial [Chthoniobacteraceae bacterium]|nr:hypothetical protein [Chthoniobacteraceae bacterium]
IHTGGRFSDSAFLILDGDDFHECDKMVPFCAVLWKIVNIRREEASCECGDRKCKSPFEKWLLLKQKTTA